MNPIIREKRRLNFTLKRITPKIIRDLAKVIKDEVEYLDEVQIGNYYVMYSVDAADNTSFESQSVEIFNENIVLEKKVVRKIGMRFYTHDNSKSIEVQIIHSVRNDKSDNFVSVSGDEPTWVNGILARLIEILNNAEEQSKFTNKFSGWIVFLGFLLFNVQYFRLFPFYEISESWVWFFKLAPLFVSLLVAINITSYIDKLWPIVELQTGPEYLQSPIRKRKKMQWIIVAIVLPLLLSTVYDLIKNNI